MPVLYTKNLPVLAPPRKLTDEEWQTLLRNRAALIAGHLRAHSTEPLGNMTFPGLGERLSEMKPRLANPEIGLDTRGIFEGLQERTGSGQNGHAILFGWGLDRNGKWLLIRFIRKYTFLAGDHAPTYQKHPTLMVDPAAQSRICRLYPGGAKDVWYELGRIARYYIERRRKAWADTQNLFYNLEVEEELVRTVFRH